MYPWNREISVKKQLYLTVKSTKHRDLLKGPNIFLGNIYNEDIEVK